MREDSGKMFFILSVIFLLIKMTKNTISTLQFYNYMYILIRPKCFIFYYLGRIFIIFSETGIFLEMLSIRFCIYLISPSIVLFEKKMPENKRLFLFVLCFKNRIFAIGFGITRVRLFIEKYICVYVHI